MNIATISPIAIQLKLVNEYDPILMLMAIKRSLKLKVLTFILQYHKLAEIQIFRSKDRLTGWQLNKNAIRIVIRNLKKANIEI